MGNDEAFETMLDQVIEACTVKAGDFREFASSMTVILDTWQQLHRLRRRSPPGAPA